MVTVMLKLTATIAAATIALASTASAQLAPTSGRSWELLTSSGALVATGAQRDAIKDAPLSTLQLSYVIDSRIAVTSMVGWARSRDLAAANDPKLDVFTFDVGAELRADRMGSEEGVTFAPFVGAGAGSRSYNYRSLDVDATHNVAGYASLGGDVGMGRVHLRLEARDYVSGFKPLTGAGTSQTRNDVIAFVGLRFTRSGE